MQTEFKNLVINSSNSIKIVIMCVNIFLYLFVVHGIDDGLGLPLLSDQRRLWPHDTVFSFMLLIALDGLVEWAAMFI